MKWFNKHKGGYEDHVGKGDVQALKANPAWQYLTQLWEEEARELNILLLKSPMVEVRNAKGQLVSPSIDNVRGQLDNLIAILTSAQVLDEAIDADISIDKMLKNQNKPGGQEDA